MQINQLCMMLTTVFFSSSLLCAVQALPFEYQYKIHGQRIQNILLNPATTVGQFKTICSEKMNTPVQNIQIFYLLKELKDDNETLGKRDYALQCRIRREQAKPKTISPEENKQMLRARINNIESLKRAEEANLKNYITNLESATSEAGKIRYRQRIENTVKKIDDYSQEISRLQQELDRL